MSAQHGWAAAASLMLAGCSDELTLDGPRASRAAAFAAEVDGARVLSFVAALVDAHRADAPIDCSAADETEFLCHVTHVGARERLATELEALGYEVEREHAVDGTFAVENVIATLPGLSTEVVLVGAHYDAGYAAADDDSTGVAVLVEVARLCRQRSFERTLRFVGFDLEELGMVGSTAYARAHAGEIVAVFNLDSVGYTAASQPALPGIALPSTGDFLTALANEPSAELAAETRAIARAFALGRVEAIIAAGDGTAPLLGLYGVGSGDHAPFWALGVPAVMLTDTGPIRHESYHSSGDDVAHLDSSFLTANARVAAAAVAYTARVSP